MNFFIDKGTMRVNRFATNIAGDQQKRKKVNVRMVLKDERPQAGLYFKVNLKQLEVQSFINDANQSF